VSVIGRDRMCANRGFHFTYVLMGSSYFVVADYDLQLINFYEGHLRWKQVDETDTDA